MSQFKKYLQIINEKKMAQSDLMPPSNKKQTAQSTYHYEYSTDGKSFVEIEDEKIISHLDSAFGFDSERFLKNIFELFINPKFIKYIKQKTNEIISISNSTDIQKDKKSFVLPLESGKQLTIKKVEQMEEM